MTAVDHPWPLVGDFSSPTRSLGCIPNNVEMPSWSAGKNSFDETLYNLTVLRLPSASSEDELDDQVALEAQSLGILPVQTDPIIDGTGSSKSTITIASDFISHSPVRSHSTSPTSCASSDHRPPTQSSRISDHSPRSPDMHPIDAERKKTSPLRRGFRKMAGFRRKRTAGLTASSTLTSINSDPDLNENEELPSDGRSPLSIKSSQNSWSHTAFDTKTNHHHTPLVDMDALKRSMECKDLLDLQMAQLAERARFLEFQTSFLSQLKTQRDILKEQKKLEHEKTIAKQTAQNEQAVEDLEARQLEEEIKVEQEYDLEKRAVMLRLRHMEAYCQNPSPPQTAVDSLSRPSSIDTPLPQRKVTDKDYHNLAQQYRERDIMDTLHASKINVLRGKQKKALENFIQKKEREMDKLERDQNKELALIDREFTSQETDFRLALDKKRTRLESRWRTQALIGRTKMERSTGLTYAPLSDVVAVEDINASVNPS